MSILNYFVGLDSENNMRPPRVILQLLVNRSPKLYILTVPMNIKYTLEQLLKNFWFHVIDSINIYLYHVLNTLLDAEIQRRINIWSSHLMGERETEHILWDSIQVIKYSDYANQKSNILFILFCILFVIQFYYEPQFVGLHKIWILNQWNNSS